MTPKVLSNPSHPMVLDLPLFSVSYCFKSCSKVLCWSLHCSPASARDMWNVSFSVTQHQFWAGILEMLLTSSRISHIGLFWILRQRGFGCNGWKQGASSFASIYTNTDFLSVLIFYWLALSLSSYFKSPFGKLSYKAQPLLLIILFFIFIKESFLR